MLFMSPVIVPIACNAQGVFTSPLVFSGGFGEGGGVLSHY